jgi:ADP-heptose:LPS heptosyltransferase
MLIRTRGGIGDSLFLTPVLPLIKTQLFCHIQVNTKYPDLFENNPYVDAIGVNQSDGMYWSYPDPIHCKEPSQHHILSVWEGAKKELGLSEEKPELKPEIYIDLPDKREGIGIQVIHKNQWHAKKVWPYFDKLAEDYEPIPKLKSLRELIRKIASYKLVVCAEGGISHIAKAVDTPAIVIFGGWSNPEWNGYEDQLNVVNKVDCSYCYNSYPCKCDFKCMKEICPKTVKNLISEAVVCSGMTA